MLLVIRVRMPADRLRPLPDPRGTARRHHGTATTEFGAAFDAARLDEAPPAVALVRLLDAGWQVTARYPLVWHLPPVSKEQDASRHAPGSMVTVRVDHGGGTVALRIANGPGRAPCLAASKPGHGLIGMRERVALLGGSLSTGPSPDGGFVVSAVLPATVPA